MRRAFRVEPERHLKGEAHESLGRVHELGVTLLWMDSDLANSSRLVRVFKTSEEGNRMPLCWRSIWGQSHCPVVLRS